MRALAWSPGPVVTTLGHIISQTGSQVLGSSRGPAANERPGRGSRDPGRPIGGECGDRVPGPAHPGCVGLSQSVPGPVATRKTAFRSPEQGYELTSACDTFLVPPAEIPSELDISEHPVQPMPGQCGGERAQARV